MTWKESSQNGLQFGTDATKIVIMNNEPQVLISVTMLKRLEEMARKKGDLSFYNHHRILYTICPYDGGFEYYSTEELPEGTPSEVNIVGERDCTLCTAVSQQMPNLFVWVQRFFIHQFDQQRLRALAAQQQIKPVLN